MDQNGLVPHILYLAWKFCIKIVSHQLTVILGLMSTMAIYWEINIPEKRSRHELLKLWESPERIPIIVTLGYAGHNT